MSYVFKLYILMICVLILECVTFTSCCKYGILEISLGQIEDEEEKNTHCMRPLHRNRVGLEGYDKLGRRKALKRFALDRIHTIQKSSHVITVVSYCQLMGVKATK